MSFNSRNNDAIYGVFADSDSDGNVESDDDYNSESSTDFPSKRKKHKKSFKKGRKHLKNDDEREVMFVPQSSNPTNSNDFEKESEEKDNGDDFQNDGDEVILDAFQDAIDSATSKPVSLSNNHFRDFLMQPDEHVIAQSNDQFTNNESANALSAKEKLANLPAVSVQSLGTWEKHTKGIGSKLLQKFGFKGRLGANESGVSKAIEVVVRPNGLGLGFGDFKEATVSKTNREIEAEWRGVPLKPTEEEEEEEERRKGRQGKKQRSNIDGGRSEIEKIAESKSWKKSAGKKQLQTATEILVQQAQELERAANKKQVIIDMRYQDVRVLTDLTKGTQFDDGGEGSDDPSLTKNRPKLGEDFLSRINQIVDLVQIEYLSARRKLTNEDVLSSSTGTTAGAGSLGLIEQIQQIDRQLHVIQGNLQGQEEKGERLSNLLEVLTRVEAKHNDPVTCASIQVKDVLKVLCSIEQKFSEEFTVFGLINLLPSLLRPILALKLSSTGKNAWRALEEPEILFSVVDSWQEGIDAWRASSSTAGPQQPEYSVIMSQCSYYWSQLMEEFLIPALRRCVSNDWHDAYDTDNVVSLFTTARILISTVQFEQLVEMVLLPKLQQAEDEWTPSGILPPIHHLLLPWLPLLKDKLARFYPEIRRKLNHYLHHWNGRDSKPLQLLLPWKQVFDESSMSNLVLRAIIPKLVVLLQQISINPSAQDTTAVESVLSWSPLLSDLYFGGLFLGEFFPKWLHTLAFWLCSPTADLEEISEWYEGWKTLFESHLAQAGESAKMTILEKPFTAALSMMSAILDNGEIYQAYAESHGIDGSVKSLLERVGAGNAQHTSYHTYIETQQADARVKERLRVLSGGLGESTSNNTRSVSDRSKRNVTGGMMSVSFKEVVESFAERSGLPFHPKHGSDQLVEGKQLYLFGTLSCYIDQNILFVQSGKSTSGNSRVWRPVDLEEALVMAQKL